MMDPTDTFEEEQKQEEATGSPGQSHGVARRTSSDEEEARPASSSANQNQTPIAAATPASSRKQQRSNHHSLPPPSSPTSQTIPEQLRKRTRNFFYPPSSPSSSPAAKNRSRAARNIHGDELTPPSLLATATTNTAVDVATAATVSSPKSQTTPTSSGSASSPRPIQQQSPSAPAPQQQRQQQQQQSPQAQSEEENRLFVEQFWKYYDDIVILSIFTQIGIVARLAAAQWFRAFDDTFRADSALFVNLPLNCISCFIMGLLASGSNIMSIIETRFTPQSQENNRMNHDTTSTMTSSARLQRLRRRKRNRLPFKNQENLQELRQVQLQALERRIRASTSLLLFPVGRQEADLMEHYFEEGYQVRRNHRIEQDEEGPATAAMNNDSENDEEFDYGTEFDRDLDQILYDVSASVAGHVSGEVQQWSSRVKQFQNASLAEGWDVGTSPQDMSDDLMLGLRDGFCGALSSFSSWNSSMVSLIRQGNVSSAMVGYLLGLQLPIVAYRFGMHCSLYIFVWKCRQETRTAERRGYGIQVTQDDDEEEDEALSSNSHSRTMGAGANDQDVQEERDTPSVRAVATALFVMAVVAQLTSLSFYETPEDQLLALSLFFSPFGVLARWRLSNYNKLRPGFPVGTFTCNLLACALSGTLGRLLAGNPGPRERLVLVAFISGFGGTLSSVASFIVELLNGIDPILFRFDGMLYAIATIFWGMVIGLISSSSVDWADQASGGTDEDMTMVPSLTPSMFPTLLGFTNDDEAGDNDL